MTNRCVVCDAYLSMLNRGNNSIYCLKCKRMVKEERDKENHLRYKLKNF